MLPKIDVPTYQIKIPSSGKEITVRPFLVKEEKLLLIAAQSKDNMEIINTTKQVINNCIVEGHRTNIDNLPFFDIDYIFIALRAKSIGETVNVNFTCNNIVDDNPCGGRFAAQIDITKCELVKNSDIKQDITLSGSIKLKMKYPTYAVMKTLGEDDITIEKKIKIISASIDQVIDKNKVYTSKDFTPNEIRNFVEGLTQDQFKKLEEYVDNFPSFVVNAEAKCPHCGFDHKIKYDNFASFFF